MPARTETDKETAAHRHVSAHKFAPQFTEQAQCMLTFLRVAFKASPSTLAQCDRSPRSPFQPGPLHSSPLQTPTMSSPLASPCSATASPIGRPPAYHNGHHRPPPAPHKSPFQSKNHWLREISVMTTIRSLLLRDVRLCLLQVQPKAPHNLPNTQRAAQAPFDL